MTDQATGKVAAQKAPSSLIYFLHALSPLHMGTGAATGGIDLPHSREVSSGLPNAPGSGLKGVLRDVLRPPLLHETVHKRLFGADKDSTDRDQGALLFSDGFLLCLPVPSFAGGFAWVTSPLALMRLQREMVSCGLTALPQMIPNPATDQVASAKDSPLIVNGEIYLHDIKLKRIVEAPAAKGKSHNQSGHAATAPPVEVPIGAHIAALLFNPVQGTDSWEADFASRFIIVAEPVLAYLSQVAMDLRTRITMDGERKVVRKGGLWTEENLPAESILWGSMAADTLRDRDNQTHAGSASLAAFIKECGARRRLQMGGKATVGRGAVQIVLHAADK